ncbi:MAG: hypothetical protein KFF50_13160 [Desulfatitalea sp.]|nr:hypothetical protein [Desulfatitalea sp.]
MKIWPSAEQTTARAIALRAMAWLIGGLLATGIALAAEPAADTKAADAIHITADRLISDSNARTAEFIGNVRAVQDQTIITADRLKLTYREGGGGPEGVGTNSLDTIEASGRVRITFDNRVAVSEKAVYTTDDKKLVLTGPESRITSGKDVITGTQITFHRETGRVEIVGDDQNQVKATIHSEESGLN